jgi:phage gp29-like protein
MPEPQALPKQPLTEELVTADVLASVGANPIAFSGADNPSAAWRQMLADSPSAFPLYRDLEEKDGQISSALETRKDGVLRRDRKVVAVSSSAQDQRHAAFAREVLAAIPNFENILCELLDAIGYGVAIAEVLWEQAGARVFIHDIKPRPQELFSFGGPGQPQTGSLRFAHPRNLLSSPAAPLSRAESRDAAGNRARFLPEHKFLVYSFRPRHGNRRGRPMLRRVFWPSWFKRQDLKFWLKFIEKGSGSVVVRYPQGATDQDKQRALEAAEAINEETAVAIPENFQIVSELLDAARGGSTDVFLALADQLCNNEIARVILGQTLTQRAGEDGHGSRALGEVHQQVRFEKVAADARDLMAVINDQLLRRLFLFNFGPEVTPPRWTIQLDPPADLSRRIEIDQRLAQLGVPLPLSYVQRTYSIPAPAPDEAVLPATPASESETP